FQDVSAVIYIAALSSFDQKLMEDESVNRMAEAIALFSAICNHPLFKSIGMIVFLNKIDLFQQKIKTVQISEYFPDYAGDFYNEGSQYFVDRFEELNKYTERTVYFHLTWATDTQQISDVFLLVRDLVIQINLKFLSL
ncbi:G protein alpha subunit CIG1, partial [Chytriomyces sp. MP71]